MYEDESMASLKEKLVRAEEVNDTFSVHGKPFEWENFCGWHKSNLTTGDLLKAISVNNS